MSQKGVGKNRLQVSSLYRGTWEKRKPRGKDGRGEAKSNAGRRWDFGAEETITRDHFIPRQKKRRPGGKDCREPNFDGGKS